MGMSNFTLDGVKLYPKLALEELERLTAKLAIAKEEVKVGDSEFALCQAENERLRAERDKFQKAWLRVDAERLDLKLANHNLWAALDVLRQSGGDRCSGYRYYWVDEAGDKLIREALQDKDHDTD